MLITELGDAGYEQDRKVKDEKLAALNSNILPFYLSRLEAIAKENDGHLALKRRTWADLYFASLYEYMNWMTEQDILANYPNLKKIVDDITSVENIKKWIAERPVTAS